MLPFYGYARQDKKHRGREPISARLMADLFKTAGADRLMAIDLHTAQIQGFFDGPVDHLMAMPILADYVGTKYGHLDLAVVSPDAGRIKVAEDWSSRLGGAPLAFIHKTRDINRPNEVVANRVVGEIKGRVCVLVDDMIDTAGTITKAADALMDQGAAGVIIAATHAILSGPAVDRLKACKVEEVIVTNTLPIPDDRRFDKLDGPLHRAARLDGDPGGLRGRLGHEPLRRQGLSARHPARRGRMPPGPRSRRHTPFVRGGGPQASGGPAGAVGGGVGPGRAAALAEATRAVARQVDDDVVAVGAPRRRGAGRARPPARRR